MEERLTWEEIQAKYPNQWVGLAEVIYRNNDGISVESAIVRYHDIPDDIIMDKMVNGEIDAIFTSPDTNICVGLFGGD